jgi:predicted metal-dependent peptidase
VLTGLITEIGEIIDKVSGPRRRLRAICCDTVAHPVQEVRRATDIQLVGGGGTDMRVGIAAAGELKPPADLIIVMTDGQTPWPERRPSSATVVVCLIGDEGDAPAWATRVRIPKEGRE